MKDFILSSGVGESKFDYRHGYINDPAQVSKQAVDSRLNKYTILDSRQYTVDSKQMEVGFKTAESRQ